MSFQGTGQSDLEVRVLHLERLLSGPQQANAEARLAAVEESMWKQSPPGNGGTWGIPAVLSGTLSAAASATAPTSAAAVFRLFDGATISAASEPSVTVFNYHNKTFASGGLVWLAWGLGVWWVIDARDCPT